MTPTTLERLTQDELDNLVRELKREEAEALIKSGREVQIEYIATTTDKSYAELVELEGRLAETHELGSELVKRIHALRAALVAKTYCAICLHSEGLHEQNECTACRVTGGDNYVHSFVPDEGLID
jgi:hypothetical protein